MIKKRLVTNDKDIKIRKSLRRKTKPAINDPASIPMNIYYKIITYDGNLFKKML